MADQHTSPRRRTRWHKQATNMVEHLRTQVLPVPGRRAQVRAALGNRPGDPRTFHALREIAVFLPADEDEAPEVERAFLTVAAMLCAQTARSRTQDLNTDNDDTDSTTTQEQDSETTPSKEEHNSSSSQSLSLGASCARSVTSGLTKQTTMEQRLEALCRANTEELHRQLPRLISHLRSLRIEVDWVDLVEDLALWHRHRQRVRDRWARDFFRNLHRHNSDSATNTEETA
ncbi:type I-E CRISPR-associated protein Cse2/CasB [Actinopolyspora mortivallis]|uniref:Type I-E CRISPR-associated protein Cse2/CasB n=1 Tax=Actinopolyspora mortivallis TaxID=33906 RepID=A0A2T0H081_ACTMO|nr:type I-E CRISPR-associated protein Cse2/CasB [Actinopolyspora mortivallis]PRW64771.1 type I-E CRISPR-associated protein Cse2/CasB [Actinopolyspora mortivallis]